MSDTREAETVEEENVKAMVEAFLAKIKSAAGVVIRTSPEATYANIRAYSNTDAVALLLAFIGQVSLSAEANNDPTMGELCRSLFKQVQDATRSTSTLLAPHGLQ